MHIGAMDQEMLIAAIGDQLDALSGLLSTTIGLALLAGWAALQGSAKVKVFSLELDRRHAFYILAASFILVNVTSLIYFLRLADILSLVDGANLARALTALETHSWPYNPFAYFGTSRLSVLHSGFGFGAMIVIWWVGYTTLSLLVEFPPKGRLELVITLTFLGVGLASMGAIQAVFGVVVDRVKAAQLIDLIDLQANLVVRRIFTFAGIAIGGLIFLIAQRLRKAKEE